MRETTPILSDWYYDAAENCVIPEGEVQINTDYETLNISAGDFIRFPKGLSCVWKISKPVRKHFKFE